MPLSALPSEPGEEWRVCADYPAYAVSSHGHVARLTATNAARPGQIRVPTRQRSGYRLSLGSDTPFVAHLVARAFLPPQPPGTLLTFVDGDVYRPTADNLCYMTNAEIQRRSIARGTRHPQTGEANGQTKITAEEAAAIRAAYGHIGVDALAARYGVNPVTIWRIVGGQRAGEMRRATPDGMPIGTLLRRYRRQRGLSQAQLAAQVGIAPQRITAWETGAQLSRYWRWVCAALDLLPRPAPARVYGHGQILHEWRRTLGLTLAALGQQLGVTRERVRQWEYGLSPLPGRLCDLLDMPVDVMVSAALRARPKREQRSPPIRGRQRVSRAPRGYGSRPYPLSRLPRADGEAWRPLPGAPSYAVSTHGRVATLRPRPLAARLLAVSAMGQVFIQTDDGWQHLSVTRLVLRTFVGPPPTPAARPAMRHRTHDPARDRHLDNLIWAIPAPAAAPAVPARAMPGYLTLTQMAALLGRKSTSNLRLLCARGLLHAERVGKGSGHWLVAAEEIERYRRERLGKPGRPSKRETA